MLPYLRRRCKIWPETQVKVGHFQRQSVLCDLCASQIQTPQIKSSSFSFDSEWHATESQHDTIRVFYHSHVTFSTHTHSAGCLTATEPQCFCRLQPASKALPHLCRLLCLRLEWRMYWGTRAFLRRSPTYLLYTDCMRCKENPAQPRGEPCTSDLTIASGRCPWGTDAFVITLAVN